jgi:hypothetical protein
MNNTPEQRAAHTCPRCNAIMKTPLVRYNGRSRWDNQTYICSRCEQLEALEDAKMKAAYTGKPYWKERVR